MYSEHIPVSRRRLCNQLPSRDAKLIEAGERGREIDDKRCKRAQERSTAMMIGEELGSDQQQCDSG